MSVRIKYKRNAFYELRRSPGVVSNLEARAARVQEACGEGYTTSSVQGEKKPQGRWRTTVAAHTYKARRDNSKNHTLERALDAGR